ncbi:oligosaccharide repeat unit polymerase [Enterobacter cloacae]|uniref:O-antigen polymerase n=1 Tax=Enterobacter cloacae TaxID=550 RepID=UPI000D3C4A4F|nr:O-antigen polymerase [Enterobacter cloacae]QCC91558.1 oligosaccharide repeat unit polymerase [Enterobacter cloacae]QCC96558.1 oligosaccharide repeat unit polymerase [Enterobacter cloacae]QCD11507.1 oligosaccharide repeat unit polymerase [Enterobacter cloacae]
MIDSLSTLLGSIILFIFAFISRSLVKDILSPAVVYPMVWAIALFFLSLITPLLGFYPINSWALLIFVGGALLFSIVSILCSTSFIFKQPLPFSLTLKDINYKRILFIFYIGTILSSPFVIAAAMNYGDNIVQIASRIRYERIHGDGDIAPKAVQNWFTFSFFLIFILISGVVQRKVKIKNILLPLTVNLLLYLLLEGRSAIIMQIFAWMFLIIMITGGVKVSHLITIAISVLCFIILGSIFVAKVDTSNITLTDQAIAYLRHILSYLYQGPILFSEYFDGKIDIRENWDAMNNFLHILNNLGITNVEISQHADFAMFGYDAEDYGNVYSIYFSIYPHYGYFGLFFFITLYSIISTIFFKLSKLGGIFCLYVSGTLFASSLLSVFMDGYGYLIYFFMKSFVFFIFVKLTCTKKTFPK